MGISPILDGVIIVLCIVALWFGANWVVDAATRIARKVGISDLIIGLTIVAIGTSAPEFAVTVSAALGGQPNISVGNVVGSNIFNLGFILGGLALFGGGIAISRALVYRDGGMLIGTTIILFIFLWDLQLQFWEGITLILLLGSYLAYLIYLRSDGFEELTEDSFKWKDIPLLLVGLLFIAVGADFFVESASNLARFFGVSDWIIGVTIVAFGTSAPEMATSAVALIKGQMDISAGNLVGSNLFNLLGVLGVAAILADDGAMLVDPAAQDDTYVLIAMCGLVVILMRTKWRLSRLEGGLLFGFGLVWLIAIAFFSASV